MLRDRLAEGLAHLGIAQRFIQRRLRNADAARRDVDAAKLQAGQSVLQAEPFHAPDQPVGRHAIVLEYEFGAVDSLVAEFLQLAADGEAMAPFPPGTCSCRDAAAPRSGSVFTSSAKHEPWMPLLIQVLVPLTT